MDARTDYHVQGAPEPTIGELIRSLLQDIGQLIRTEIKLAQAEVGQNVSRAKTPLMFMVLGGLLMFGAFLTLLAAFVGWLADAVGPGWAAFIVTVVLGGAGIALIMSGKKKMSTVALAPTRTVASVKQDAQALKGNS
jgi:predicted phage tail protein